ncbi:unnamed protein product [Closterium sp. Yama58-4]|nr:unnamed protein product [Closterium sp. Yama58-4]
MVLEVSQYLEKYLWPNFEPETASVEHVMSIILMVNEKFRENVSAWDCFQSRADVFPAFFNRVLALKVRCSLSRLKRGAGMGRGEGEFELSMYERVNYIRLYHPLLPGAPPYCFATPVSLCDSPSPTGRDPFALRFTIPFSIRISFPPTTPPFSSPTTYSLSRWRTHWCGRVCCRSSLSPCGTRSHRPAGSALLCPTLDNAISYPHLPSLHPPSRWRTRWCGRVCCRWSLSPCGTRSHRPAGRGVDFHCSQYHSLSALPSRPPPIPPVAGESTGAGVCAAAGVSPAVARALTGPQGAGAAPPRAPARPLDAPAQEGRQEPRCQAGGCGVSSPSLVPQTPCLLPLLPSCTPPLSPFSFPHPLLQSLENPLVRACVLPLVSLPLWHALSPARRERELHPHAHLLALWTRLLKRDAKNRAARLAAVAEGGEKRAEAEAAERKERRGVRFLPGLILEFFSVLDEVVEKGPDYEDDQSESAGVLLERAVDQPRLLFCERFLELLIDLLSQLPTRRFFRPVVDDMAVAARCRFSRLYRHPRGRHFVQLVDLLRFYARFQMDDHAGRQLDEEEVDREHCARVSALQLFLFNKVPELRDIALTNVGSIEHADGVRKWMGRLTDEQLAELVLNKLKLLSRAGLPYRPPRHLLSSAHRPKAPTRMVVEEGSEEQQQQQEEEEEEEAEQEEYWAQQRAVLFHRLRPFLEEVVVSFFEKKRSQRAALNALPLYPNEDVMWDESLIPSVNYTGEGCLALPKLNLQFLTLHDYLLRNFNLFRLESTYEIREEVHDVLKRMGAKGSMYSSVDRDTEFTGWARMAIQISSFRIVEVKAPLLGEVQPAAVLAEVEYSIAGYKAAMRSEWEEIKEHDVLFLLAIHPDEIALQAAADAAAAQAAAQAKREAGEDGAEEEEAAADAAAVVSSLSVPQRYGLRYVRGCEVIELRDEDNKLMNDFSGRVKREEWKPPKGNKRTALVALDPAQFQLDLEANGGTLRGAQEEVYSALNVVMRRKPKENNFKPILESIRDLMNEEASVPGWLHDLFLGYDDPAAASWRRMPAELAPWRVEVVDFRDTFVDAEHLRECFSHLYPGFKVRFVDADGFENPNPQPPFRVTIPMTKQSQEEGHGVAVGGKKKGQEKEGKESVPLPDPGPYPPANQRKNHVRFTPTQVDAIISGVQPGLTMIVGPPGTGKTDTAVQILQVLYHNCPEQRTLVITHSNQALNDLFEKIMQRDVPARYMLRLGMGEQELDTEQKFSRMGRVNDMLARRLELLAEVERLAVTLGRPSDVAYTCESAAYFWLLHVLARAASIVRDTFPFTEFFQEAPGFKMTGGSYAQDMRMAESCFEFLKGMFQELEECRAFELFKTTADRSNYLMARQAKVVAMTCTHAALKRRDFLNLGFHFDNLLMEESAQILEIETFIPMLLQRPDGPSRTVAGTGTGTGTTAAAGAAGAAGAASGGGDSNSALSYSRLKRCILIGDHNQLPPVVKNMAFQKYSRMDQSLFTRFVRLGVPYIELNAQGRARPSIAQLYNWRYRDLGDLPVVKTGEEYVRGNGGFAWEYQLVDVGDWMGRGESEPNPWFYQNLGEAEYVVSVFQYMRLLGYPAEKISILTTYNGQKHLIRDVIERRCAGNPRFGRPSKVTTVDRFQGQQNDYILLSLVRTRTVGHLRDVRRLVVAMSRARLGLYCFCRRSLFEQCYELQPTFQLLLQRPDRLGLVLEEGSARTGRETGQGSEGAYLVGGIEEMARLVEWRLQMVTEQCYELQPTFQLLLQRLDRLGLVLEEGSARTGRKTGEGSEGAYLVGGIEEMARLMEWRLQMVTEQILPRRKIMASRKKPLSEQLAELLTPAPTAGHEDPEDAQGFGAEARAIFGGDESAEAAEGWGAAEAGVVRQGEAGAGRKRGERRSAVKEKGLSLRGNLVMEGREYGGSKSSRSALFDGWADDVEGDDDDAEDDDAEDDDVEDDVDERMQKASDAGRDDDQEWEGGSEEEGEGGEDGEDNADEDEDNDDDLSENEFSEDAEDEALEGSGDELEGGALLAAARATMDLGMDALDRDFEAVLKDEFRPAATVAGRDLSASNEDDDDEDGERVGQRGGGGDGGEGGGAPVAIAKSAFKGAVRDEDKGRAVAAQRALWDRALELRIALQRPLQSACRLPHARAHAAFAAVAPDVAAEFQAVAAGTRTAIRQLLTLQDELFTRNAAVDGAFKAAREALAGGGSGSGEEEGGERARDGATNGGLSGGLGFNLGSIEDGSSEEVWEQISRMYERFRPFSQSSIDSKGKSEDGRASIGRKVRYAPMPALVNFMAPEPMQLPPVVDRLFGNLFGQVHGKT